MPENTEKLSDAFSHFFVKCENSYIRSLIPRLSIYNIKLIEDLQYENLYIEVGDYGIRGKLFNGSIDTYRHANVLLQELGKIENVFLYISEHKTINSRDSIAAYLDDTALKSSNIISKKSAFYFYRSEMKLTPTEYLDHIFGISREYTNDTDRLLKLGKRCNRLFERYQNISDNFKYFAKLEIEGFIKEQLRKGNQNEKYNKWNRINRVTEAGLRKALKHSGIVNDKSRAYQIIWQLYKNIYQEFDKDKIEDKLKENNQKIIGELNRRFASSQEVNSDLISKELNISNIVECINTIYDAITRHDRRKQENCQSLDSEDADGQTKDQKIPDEKSLIPSALREMYSIVTSIYDEMEPQYKIIWGLLCLFDISQTQVGRYTGVEQPAISRRIRASLRNHIIPRLDAELDFSIDNTSQYYHQMLEDYLCDRYQQLICEHFESGRDCSELPDIFMQNLLEDRIVDNNILDSFRTQIDEHIKEYIQSTLKNIFDRDFPYN